MIDSNEVLLKIDSKIDRLGTTVDKLGTTVDQLGTTVDKLGTTVDKVYSELIDLKSHVHSNMVTKNEFEQFKTGIFSHVDGFIKLHQTLDLELVSLRHKYEHLEERLQQVEKKVGIAVS